ncbi:MAG: ABC transporter permease [Christensenellales bacterium]|jgi:putative aldouronate transport system permease protein
MNNQITRSPALNEPGKVKSYFAFLKKDLIKFWGIYMMFLPVLAFYLVFHYAPMYGAQIAFKDYSPGLGIVGSSWVGLKHFTNFFTSPNGWRIIRNTVFISGLTLFFGFPAPIILALLINEIKSRATKKFVQTVTYLPYFISMMVVCSLIINFTSKNGLINDISALFGGTRTSFLLEARYYRTVHVVSGVWQNMGWNSIIYLAALSAVDQELYEAAVIDGAGRWKQTVHITVPSIMNTIVIMLILRTGQLMSVGAEKILLLYTPTTYETADVISTYVYRRGLQEFSYSFSSAVGLFNSVVNLLFVSVANAISRRYSETSLW